MVRLTRALNDQRLTLSAVGTTIYTTVLNNVLKDETAKRVPEAVAGAGLASDQIPDLLAVLSTPEFATWTVTLPSE